ncbi:unnamed protein product [Polarella glacialis]|uniref:Uncharacterized protein n=1 Tax=Polarella glacialis TaxID=89957 RepID=A0A813GFS0_POLGL|nr:unnamed protein product [Polarella glacialis]
MSRYIGPESSGGLSCAADLNMSPRSPCAHACKQKPLLYKSEIGPFFLIIAYGNNRNNNNNNKKCLQPVQFRWRLLHDGSVGFPDRSRSPNNSSNNNKKAPNYVKRSTKKLWLSRNKNLPQKLVRAIRSLLDFHYLSAQGSSPVAQHTMLTTTPQQQQ